MTFNPKDIKGIRIAKGGGASFGFDDGGNGQFDWYLAFDLASGESIHVELPQDAYWDIDGRYLRIRKWKMSGTSLILYPKWRAKTRRIGGFELLFADIETELGVTGGKVSG